MSIYRCIRYFIIFNILLATLIHWFRRFSLPADATTYLTAAINLVKHGKLFVWVNWPSYSNLPVPEPYTAFMPGFPLFLAPFLFVFRDPTWAGMIAQAFVYVGVILALYYCSLKIGITFLLRVAMLLFIMKFWSFAGFWENLLSEPLFALFSLGLFFCGLELMESNAPKKFWLPAYFFVFCSALLRWNGFGNAAILLLPLINVRPISKMVKKAIVIASIAVAPNLLWYVRNFYEVGKGLGMHEFQGILWEKLAYPFGVTVYRWGNGSTILTIAIFLLPFVLFSVPWFRDQLKQKEKRNILFLMWNIFIHFFTIYAISLVVNTIAGIDDRFLANTYIFFSIFLFYAIHLLVGGFIDRWENKIIIGSVIVLAIMLPAKFLFKKRSDSQEKSMWTYFSIPKEQELWKIIKTRPYFSRSNQFFSDFNPIHQIYAGYPQRIIWQSTIEQKPNEIPSYWGLGKDPFIVVSKGSPLDQLFAERFAHEDKSIQVDEINDFVVYYKN